MLKGRAAIQANNLEHRLTRIACFSEGKCGWDTITLCDRMGWAGQQDCRKDLGSRSWWTS